MLGGRPRKAVAEKKRSEQEVAAGKQETTCIRFGGNTVVIHHNTAPVTVNISGNAGAAPALAGSKRRIERSDKDDSEDEDDNEGDKDEGSG